LLDEFDGKILNPSGVEIDLPFCVFKRLKKARLLQRDSSTRIWRIQERWFGLMDLWDDPDFKPDRRCRALDPGSGVGKHKGLISIASAMSLRFRPYLPYPDGNRFPEQP
jgi:hypothetical protein